MNTYKQHKEGINQDAKQDKKTAQAKQSKNTGLSCQIITAFVVGV